MDDNYTPVGFIRDFLDGLDENVPTSIEVIGGRYFLCVYDKDDYHKIFQMGLNPINN